MRLIADLAFRLSARAHRNGPPAATHNPAASTASDYRRWRDSELVKQFADNFAAADIIGKRVLDFGCGTGELSHFVHELDAASVIGTDVYAPGIEQARRGGAGPTFMVGSPSRIDLPDESVDVILCFDVMEHIMDYRAIIPEWRRVLAPGGRVLIWWSVWMHPYGHHAQAMVPLPWIHLLLSDEELVGICARVYDLPAFRPQHWHFRDGRRIENPYRGMKKFGHLNKLNTWAAERQFRAAGLEIVRLKALPFSGRMGAVKRLLVRLPRPDPFCSAMIYELRAGMNGLDDHTAERDGVARAEETRGYVDAMRAVVLPSVTSES